MVCGLAIDNSKNTTIIRGSSCIDPREFSSGYQIRVVGDDELNLKEMLDISVV